MQAPLTQACPAPHAVPHAPQFWKLISVSTHWLLHSVLPAGQPQVLAMQACPGPHAVPQLPQLFESLVVSTQLAPQSTSGEVHPVAHVPLLQT